jgi:pilus assembly protein CpaB
VNSRRITLVVAIVLAVTTGLLTLRYLSTVNQQAQTQAQVIETRQVVIANHDIPTHMKITPEMLTIVKRPVTEIEPGAIADPHQAIGDVSLIAIPANSTVTDTKIGQPASVGLTGRLKRGMRAVTIPVDAIKSLNGLIQPGDRVDVLASVARGSSDRPRTFAIIRGALVLALNSTIDPVPDESPGPGGSSGGGVPSTVTLGVTVQQADLLTVADLNATLRLALRPPDEPLHAEPAEVLDFQQEVARERELPPPVQPSKAPVVAVVPKKERPSVTIVDGDKLIQGNQ